MTTTLALASLTATEEAAASWDVSDWFRDPDGDALTYAATGAPSWLTLNAMSELTIAEGATDDAEVAAGPYTFTLTATDDSAAMASVTHTVTLVIADDPDDGTVTEPDPASGGMDGSNMAPTLTDEAPTAMAPLTADEGAAADWDVTDWFDDPDGDTLTYTAMDLPDWLDLDSNGELGIEAESTDEDDVKDHVFVIVATDDGGEEATLTVTLAVESPNAAPAVVTGSMAPPATVTADEGGTAQAFTLATWFSDPDGDTLAFTLGKDGPDWATINTAMGILNLAFGDTDDADVGMHTLVVTASDPDDESVSHSVVVTVENVNDAPVAASGAPAMLTAMEGLAAMWTVSDWFTDEDAGDTLTYTAMLLEGSGESQTAVALPDWLVFDAAMGELTIAAGMTDDAQLGMYTLAVTAMDKAAAMVVHMATLEITDTKNEPTLANSALTNPRIAPATGGMIVLDLTGSFTDLDEAGDDAAAALTFEVSSSIDDTAATNIITAMITGAMLTLTPGTASDELWKQETVSITAVDTEGGRGTAAFTVTTRANVLDTTELAPAHGFIIQGDMAADRLGHSVSGAGDVNGDGIDDLIAGARFGGDGGTIAGEAYIIYGKAGDGTQFGMAETGGEGRQVVDTTSLVPADGFIIHGDEADSNLGHSVSGAGDVNGDGLADLIVGANTDDDGGNSAGEAYIVYGKAGTGSQFGTAVRVDDDGMTLDITASDGVVRQVLDTSMLAPAAGFIIRGDMLNDELGQSVSGAGDINGDGLADLITGASLGNDGGNFAGEAYIIYGKPNPATEADAGMQFGMADSTTAMRRVVDTTELSPTDGFILQGDAGRDRLGQSVSGAGDINGDGLADLIVGANGGGDGGDDAGEAYIVYGKAGNDGTQFGTAVRVSKSHGDTVTDGTADGTTVVRQVLDTSMLAPADGFILQGDVAEDRLGHSVSGAGDINGDGRDDLIVGAWGGDGGGDDAGEAYIIYGKGGMDGTQFGEAVTISVSVDTEDSTNTKTTTITDGRTLDNSLVVRQVLDTSMLAPAAGFILQGDAAGDELGISVAGAGDVNGDGLADLIAGALDGDDGGVEAGEAYIIYGKAGTDGMQFGTAVGSRQVLDTTGLAPTDGFILQGDAADDQLGRSVSGAGDVNGDGFDDLIAGARRGDDGGLSAGEAYVVYGGTHLGEVTTQDQTLTGGMVPTLGSNPTPEAVEAAAQAAFLHGGAGDDTLTAHADTTVLYGGAGDDTLELVDYSFRRVDGGSGDDTLVLGSGVELDFTLAKVRGKVRGIETLSLSDGTAMVTLDQASVFALVESRDNGDDHTAAGEALLRIAGTSGTVTLSDMSDWNETPNAEGTADLWTQGSAKLLIDDGVAVA